MLPPPPTRSATRLATAPMAVLAMVALVVSAPLATWWLIGPNPGNEIGGDPTLRPDDYDYLIHPPVIAPGLERFAGVASVLVVVASVIVLVRAARADRLDRLWWSLVVVLALSGAVVGAAGRVLTAAVVGANIGGGFIILFGFPMLLVLVIGVSVRTFQVVRTTTIERT